MKLLYCVAPQRNGSFSTLIATAFSSDGSKWSCVPRSYRIIGASSHRGRGFKPPSSNGSRHLRWSLSQGWGRSSYSSSGFQNPYCIATGNIRQLEYNRGNPMNIKDFNCLSATKTSHRFISGGPALWGLVAANSAVFGMWQTMNPQFMNMHFVASAANVASGRWYTFITAAFSHASVEHLLWNLLGLVSFGMLVEEMYGAMNLLIMYGGASMCGSFGHIKYVTLVHPWLKDTPLNSNNMVTPGCLGASGVVIAFVILIILHRPNHPVDFLLWSMPAAAVGCLIVGKDLYLALQGRLTVSAGAHLGGAAYGLLIYSVTLLNGAMSGP